MGKISVFNVEKKKEIGSRDDQFFNMADTLRTAASLKFYGSSMELETQTSKSSILNMFLKTTTLSCFFLVSLSTQSSNLEKIQMLLLNLSELD